MPIVNVKTKIISIFDKYVITMKKKFKNCGIE